MSLRLSLSLICFNLYLLYIIYTLIHYLYVGTITIHNTILNHYFLSSF